MENEQAPWRTPRDWDRIALDESQGLDPRVIAWVLAAVEYALVHGQWDHLSIDTLVKIGQGAARWLDGDRAIRWA